MIGLEYILRLYGISHIELAEKLGIKKQNVNMWIKDKQKIPEKHFSKLSDIFEIERKYFDRHLNDMERIDIQKEKLKRDISRMMNRYEEQGEFIYDRSDISKIEKDIDKIKLVHRFKMSIEDSDSIESYREAVELLEKSEKKSKKEVYSE